MTTPMTTPMTPGPNTIAITLDVSNEVEARELQQAWEEIVTHKKLARTEALEHSVDAVMERARLALGTIERTMREHPTKQ